MIDENIHYDAYGDATCYIPPANVFFFHDRNLLIFSQLHQIIKSLKHFIYIFSLEDDKIVKNAEEDKMLSGSGMK